VNRINNPHSNDWLNLIKVSESEELKSLNYSHAVDVIKASNSHDFDEMATLILDYLYDLRRCNKHSHDLDELNSKQISIEIKFDLLTHSINNDLLTRRSNDKDVSTWNVLDSVNWYNAIDDRWGQHYRDEID
jgi:hypothetical protein